ncbi:MAG: ATP-binding cassette domain-containing protein, partial [Longimicrobiaceae bacterium]
VDHLLLPEANALPALLVTRLPNGFTHFVVVWSRHGRRVQVMDPAFGHRRVPADCLLADAYVHAMPVPAAAWREWAGGDEFGAALRARIRALGAGAGETERAVAEAAADPGWRPLAALDAAVRLADALVQARAIPRGAAAVRLVAALARRARESDEAVPSSYWSVTPVEVEEGEEPALRLRGAVLVRVRGVRPDGGAAAAERSPELAAALTERPPSAFRALLELLRAGDPPLHRGALAAGMVAAAAAVGLEALVLRAALGIGRSLGLVEQRLQAAAALACFVVALLLLEGGLSGALLRLGRRLEVRMRAAFLDKVPRLPDRYLQSRPTSDMGERSHALHHLRQLPRFAGLGARLVLQMAITAAALLWLAPGSGWITAVLAAASVGIPLAMLPLLREHDLRIRTHNGALGRFYLDTLLGLLPVRAHGAESAVRREHESLLVEWVHAGRMRLGALRLFVGVHAAATLALGGILLLHHAARAGDAAGTLLLVYWVLLLATLGVELAFAAQQAPVYRNVTLRSLEPLGAPEDDGAATSAAPSPCALERNPSPVPGEGGGRSGGEACTEPSEDGSAWPDESAQGPGYSTSPGTGEVASLSEPERALSRGRHSGDGVAVEFDGVAVRAGGHTLLADVTARIAPGTHVAVVGPSGAGKSTLVGTLLGWHRPAEGALRVDGRALEGAALDALRARTAWLEPAVHLWNRTLLENLLYGAGDDAMSGVDEALGGAELYPVLDRLPDGLQTPLGEGGGLLSGGEGQRVRLGRALLRRDARLVVVDEPFRGLDHGQRGRLLQAIRRRWRSATLFCVTHDLAETRDFDRVLVIEGGRLVEDGDPACLAADPASRYAALLRAETEGAAATWGNPAWRRLRLAGGRLADAEAPR